jgi:hypothetical protein
LLGCLVIVAACFGGYSYVAPIYVAVFDPVIAVLLAAGPVSLGVLIGLALIFAGCAGRRPPRPARIALWAKLVILAGLIPSLSVPLITYGILLFKERVAADLTYSTAYPDAYDPGLVSVTLQASMIPIVIGTLAILVALAFGWRKKPANVLNVFD